MYLSFGAVTVVAVMFDTPIEVATQRNAGRERVVPDFVLERMHAALHREPVSIDEGFDKVFTVLT